jgi:hypothetical protein
MIFLDYSYVIYLLSDTLFLLANVRVCLVCVPVCDRAIVASLL